MKIAEMKPIPMAEAKAIMLKKEKQKELNYEQKLATEHLKKFTKLSESDAAKFIEQVSNVVKMSPETLMQIINILPKNADEVRMIFAREKFSLKEDELTKLLEIISKFK